MEEKKINVNEVETDLTEEKSELFEEVEEVVTAGWTGCASCCS